MPRKRMLLPTRVLKKMDSNGDSLIHSNDFKGFTIGDVVLCTASFCVRKGEVGVIKGFVTLTLWSSETHAIVQYKRLSDGRYGNGYYVEEFEDIKKYSFFNYLKIWLFRKILKMLGI